MTDSSAAGHGPHVQRRPRAEYYAYFSLILALALPVETAVSAGRLMRGTSRPGPGPVARARRTAAEITPVIFWP